jgi:hypothetical protein
MEICANNLCYHDFSNRIGHKKMSLCGIELGTGVLGTIFRLRDSSWRIKLERCFELA